MVTADYGAQRTSAMADEFDLKISFHCNLANCVRA